MSGDTEAIKDISDQIETSNKLFSADETMNGTVYNDKIMEGEPEKDDNGIYAIPSYVQD